MKCNNRESKNGRLVKPSITIGFFIESINYSFHYEMLSGIHRVASEHGVNMICYLGKALNSPDFMEKPANVVYDLAGHEILDGLIIASSITIYDSDPKLIERYSYLPLVVIANKIDGVASIRVDNESGFRELLNHLVQDHGYRRLAFIGGSEDTVDARERYNIYRTVLAENGIKFDPDLITSGRFSQEKTAVEAVKLYLDQRKAVIDVIVAANDVLAKGAIKELLKRKIKVPDDIAVTGFDDQHWAKYFICPLTTVRQSISDMGKCGAELLLKLISGKPAPQDAHVPGELIIRNSCGCFSTSIVQAAVESVKNISVSTAGTAQVDLNTWSKMVAPAMIQAVGGDNKSGLIRENIMWLIDSFVSDILNPSGDNFVRTLQNLMKKIAQSDLDPALWQNVITAMQQFGLSHFGSRANIYLAENLWHQARLIIGEAIIQVELNRNYRVLEQTFILHTTSQMMAMSSRLSELAEGVYINLSKLGIGNCYLSLYEEPEAPGKKARLILAFRDRIRIQLPPGGVIFPTRYLAPREMLPKDKNYLLGAFPLYFRDEQLALLLMDINTIERCFYNSFICEILCNLIGGALKRVLIIEKLQKQEQLLNERTSSLTRVNQELEQFAGIISQDLQQPLCGLAVYLHLIENDYKGKIDIDADEFIDFAVDGVSRMSDLINNLLQYSRVNNTTKPFEKVDVNQILETVKLNLKVAIEERQATVVEGIMPEILADPGQLIQLFQNLIGNAIKFQDQKPPVVMVNSFPDGEDWLFTVQDNGIGLDMQYADRIFMIFQRLNAKKDYPGTGIGLSVCKKIVERHGGRIWVESEPGKGTTFYFTIRT